MILLSEPSDIVPSKLTHILYAFADIDSSTGSAKMTDSYADEQVCFPESDCPEKLILRPRPRNITLEIHGMRPGTICTGV